ARFITGLAHNTSIWPMTTVLKPHTRVRPWLATTCLDTHGWELGSRQDGVDLAPHLALVERRADGRREDEPGTGTNGPSGILPDVSNLTNREYVFSRVWELGAAVPSMLA